MLPASQLSPETLPANLVANMKCWDETLQKAIRDFESRADDDQERVDYEEPAGFEEAAPSVESVRAKFGVFAFLLENDFGNLDPRRGESALMGVDAQRHRWLQEAFKQIRGGEECASCHLATVRTLP
jgi:hypothetical protein